MKVLPLPYKRRDLRVARMTALKGLNQYSSAKYNNVHIKCTLCWLDNDFYSFSPNGFGMKLSSQTFEKGRNGLRVLERPRRLRARRLPKFSPQEIQNCIW